MGVWGRTAYWLSGVPPRALQPSRGEGGHPPCAGRGRGLAPPSPVSGISRAGGEGVGGESGGGRVVVPRHPPPGGWTVAPGPGPPSWPAAWRRASPPAACSAGAVWQPRAPSAVLLAAGGSVWRGGGWSVRRPSSGGWPGGPAGRGAGGSLCCAPSLRPPRAGTKAGHFVIAPPSKLHWLTSACHRPGTAHRLPLRAGAGLRACCGYCGSGQAADWQRVSRQLRPYLGVATLSGEGGGSPAAPSRGGAGPPSPWPALCCPWVRGGEGEGGEGGGLPAVAPWSPGAAPRWLREGGLVDPAPGGPAVDGGGRTPLLLPSTFRALGRCAGPHPRAPRSPRRRRLTAWYRWGGGGGGEGPAVAGGGGPGHRLMISGLQGSGVSAPRASARSRLPPSPLLGAARVPPLR